MIDAIINFFTDNRINLGLSRFLMRFVNYSKVLESSVEIDDNSLIENIKCQFEGYAANIKSNTTDDIKYLLLVKFKGTIKWEITAIDKTYKYIGKSIIQIDLPPNYIEESYYIRVGQ